jgi:hypothetical protein
MNTGPLVGFEGTISDQYGDSWNGFYVYEVDPSNTSPDSDSCWWAENPLDLPQTPSIAYNTQQNDGHNYWLVASGNQYGYDFVGFNPGFVNQIVSLHPSTVHMPCTITVAQEMEVECSASEVWQYVENILTMSLNSQYAYKSCRNNQSTGAVVCGCGMVTSSGFRPDRFHVRVFRTVRESYDEIDHPTTVENRRPNSLDRVGSLVSDGAAGPDSTPREYPPLPGRNIPQWNNCTLLCFQWSALERNRFGFE